MEFNMKTSLLGGSVVLAGVMAASAAFAADLPARRGPVLAPALTPVFNWTGFYAGLNAGYSFNDNKAATVGTPGFIGLGAAVPSRLNTGRDGFIGGGQVGYLAQFGQAVIGAEADLQYIDNKRATAFVSPALGGLATTAGSEMSYLGTLRARLGFAADRFLVYVHGGLAYGNPQNTAAVAAAGPGALWGGSSSASRFGYAVGAGVEYALTNNWTARLEYMYYDLGRRTVTAVPLNAAAAATGVAYQARFENNGSIVRGAINYKF
jgi:outer membrane immunogenic protein